jgi:hypothetical protein
MSDRNSIVEKLRALLSKTVENGCTESEMLAALDKAAAMRDAYDVSDEELQLTKEEKVALHAEPKDAADQHQLKWRLSSGVRMFCGVQIYRRPHQTGLHFIGLPSDVELASWLLDTLADFVFGALYEHLIGCLAPKSDRRTIIRSFVESCCNRINEWLLELVERSRQVQTSNGRELVVVKDTAIKAFMKDNRIQLRATSCGGRGNVDEAASTAGRAAGDRATFGRPVSGTHGVLRLGGAWTVTWDKATWSISQIGRHLMAQWDSGVSSSQGGGRYTGSNVNFGQLLNWGPDER